MGSNEVWNLENGITNGSSHEPRLVKTAHSLSASSLRRKSELAIGLEDVRPLLLKRILINFQEVILGTKICPLFLAIPFAIVAQSYGFGRPWIFALSLLGLAPLAERVSFLTEQIAYYTGPTVGGLLNATCGNATELIIAIFALYQRKIDVVKYSLLGSILSNLLLVLGTSLLCGGLANLSKEQRFDRNSADVNVLLLSVGVLCHALPLLSQLSGDAGTSSADSSILLLSRVSSIVLLVAYMTYLFFQLKTHRQLFESQEEDENDEDEKAVVGFWSSFAWLVGMTVAIALLSEYIVGTIEDASSTWGIPISFLSIILLPIVGNAAEHAGAIIFAFKNKLDISLGVALGSATQISIFVVPLCVVVGWILQVDMDLSLSTLETGSLAISVVIVAFALQDGSSHYMKGAVLLFAYIVISACFLILQSPQNQGNLIGSGYGSSVGLSSA